MLLFVETKILNMKKEKFASFQIQTQSLIQTLAVTLIRAYPNPPIHALIHMTARNVETEYSSKAKCVTDLLDAPPLA